MTLTPLQRGTLLQLTLYGWSMRMQSRRHSTLRSLQRRGLLETDDATRLTILGHETAIACGFVAAFGVFHGRCV